MLQPMRHAGAIRDTMKIEDCGMGRKVQQIRMTSRKKWPIPKASNTYVGELMAVPATLQGMVQSMYHVYSLWGSNPRPMAHKTIALTTELREPNKELVFKATS